MSEDGVLPEYLPPLIKISYDMGRYYYMAHENHVKLM
ncbi:hypothetical protein SAMN02746065_13515 [Desulfocicer vacuolatum DSM 3385]|uniref:Uncharacterized protein n=1 Tax=Desulfocicer vacuolatum DSM 3385 TaxID=1121400 RepID=A0A1W2EMU0_9BACT|nr:hypothetical protein SAMN02746065_13515 [Desulfocicer vacuolatum DSM 3385]